jgi:small-conductance mechanosensitive channel
VQEIIEAQSLASFDRVSFKEYGNSSLEFEIVYYLLTSDYEVFMDTQHVVNLELFRRFAEEGIEFA